MLTLPLIPKVTNLKAMHGETQKRIRPKVFEDICQLVLRVNPLNFDGS
jgi:hypothetical protein